MRAATPPVARLAGLAGLAAFGAWQWGLMVSPGAAGRILLAFAAAGAAAGLIVLGARRGRAARAALTAVAALGSVALALLAAGSRRSCWRRRTGTSCWMGSGRASTRCRA